MTQPSRFVRWLAGLECAWLRWLLKRVRRQNVSKRMGAEARFNYNPREVALMARLSWLKLRSDAWRWSVEDKDWYWFDNPLPPWPEWRACGEEKARNQLWNAYVKQTIEQAVEEWGIFKQPEEPFTAAELVEWDKAAIAARAAGVRQRGALL